MGQIPGMQIQSCDSVEEFLAAIQHTPLVSKVLKAPRLFRGESDSTWELLPSAHRTDENSKKKNAQIASLLFNYSADVEVSVLIHFYREADRNGLSLPPLSPDDHDRLIAGDTSRMEFLVNNKESLRVFGLAQHYGLPTRLLDWTWDPFVAAYFAASGACQKLISGNLRDTASKLAVSYFDPNDLDTQVCFVHPPYSGNPNLAAQKGAFTFVGYIEPTPLNACVLDDSRSIVKVTIPVALAPRLLLELRHRGYDAGRLFPGYRGAAKAVEELALLNHFSELSQQDASNSE